MAIKDTPNGYNPWEVMSALQKCIRRGMEYEAFWWAHELCINKQTTLVWNRLVVIACEDVGIGNPQAIVIVNSCRQSWDNVNGAKPPEDWEWNILAYAIIVLCRSDKSRSADDLSHIVWLRKEGRDPLTREPSNKIEKEHLPIPDFAFDMHTMIGKRRLSAESVAKGIDVDECMTRHFREESARLDRPIRDLSNDGTNWTEEVCKIQKCNSDIALTPIDPIKGS